MSDVNSVSGSGSASTSAMSQALSGQQLTQEDFLKLMIEQFRSQDPTKPMDNSQFVGQMAQFSQITATQQMQSSFDSLSKSMQAGQVLNASSLIGRQVLAPSTSGTLGEDGLSGAVNVSTGGQDITVKVVDSSGKTVRTLDLGTQDAGLAKFSWDGLDDDGNAMPAGSYSLVASDGDNQLSTYVRGTVSGVGYAGADTGTYLQVDGLGGVLMNQIAQIL